MSQSHIIRVDMHNQNTQSLPKIKFTHKFLSWIFSKLRFSLKFSFCLPPTRKPHIILNVENNNKDQTWRNRATLPNRMRKLFPNEPTNSTPNVLSQPRPTTKTKNQVKNHTQKHKHTKKTKTKTEDSKSHKNIGLPPNKRWVLCLQPDKVPSSNHGKLGLLDWSSQSYWVQSH